VLGLSLRSHPHTLAAIASLASGKLLGPLDEQSFFLDGYPVFKLQAGMQFPNSYWCCKVLINPEQINLYVMPYLLTHYISNVLK
jgi:hypothetical protein